MAANRATIHPFGGVIYQDANQQYLHPFGGVVDLTIGAAAEATGTVSVTAKGVPSIVGASGTHTFDYKIRDLTDSKVSTTYTVTITVA